MKQYSVEVSEETYQAIASLAATSGESMTSIVEKAVDRYRRERLLQNANADWAKILEDDEARAEFDAEDALWDQTAGDGLLDDPWSATGEHR